MFGRVKRKITWEQVSNIAICVLAYSAAGFTILLVFKIMEHIKRKENMDWEGQSIMTYFIEHYAMLFPLLEGRI